MFPSHGPRGEITGVLKTGRTVRLDRNGVAVSRPKSINVRSYDSGYSVRLGTFPRGAMATAISMRAQSSAPHPGPSLAIRIARGTIWQKAHLVARLTLQPGLALATDGVEVTLREIRSVTFPGSPR